MAEGYIKLHRKLQEHGIWTNEPFTKGQAWVDLILTANHKKAEWFNGASFEEIERGELITSEVKLSKRWKWGRSKVRNFLEMLQKARMINKETDTKRTKLKIVQYCVWQDEQTTNKHPANNGQTTNEQPADTNNNDNNDNNDNKSVALNQILDFYQSSLNLINYKEHAQHFYDKMTSDNWVYKGKKVNNWKSLAYAFIKNIKIKSGEQMIEVDNVNGHRKIFIYAKSEIKQYFDETPYKVIK